MKTQKATRKIDFSKEQLEDYLNTIQHKVGFFRMILDGSVTPESIIADINLKISDDVEAYAIAEKKAENQIWIDQINRQGT